MVGLARREPERLEPLDHRRGRRRRHVEPLGERRGRDRRVAALRQRPDRLRVVLDGVRDLGGLGAGGGHQIDTSSPVTYMTARPVSSPPHGERMEQAAGAVADLGRDLHDHLGDRPGADPEHERGKARAGRRTRRSRRRGSRARRRSGRAAQGGGRARPVARATGATIASPSVVLWSAKPTISAAPSASEPTAYADPIARPSPRLWSPMPIATSSAAW